MDILFILIYLLVLAFLIHAVIVKPKKAPEPVTNDERRLDILLYMRNRLKKENSFLCFMINDYHTRLSIEPKRHQLHDDLREYLHPSISFGAAMRVGDDSPEAHQARKNWVENEILKLNKFEGTA